MKFSELITIDESDVMVKVKVRGQRSKSSSSKQSLPQFGRQLQFEFTDGYEMMQKNFKLCRKCVLLFLTSSINIQGHMGQNINDLYLNWAFPDCKSSFSSSGSLDGLV